MIYAIDKWKAKHQKWRIPETTLLCLAMAGGALGAYIGMQLFRHKTKHKKFTFLVPLFLLLWLVGVIYFSVETSGKKRYVISRHCYPIATLITPSCLCSKI
jgi:uncharacterized membrane protein YsdA (DUF1294 family)